MSDVPLPQFFRTVTGSRKRGLVTVPSAFVVVPGKPLFVTTTRLSWSPLFGGRIRELAAAAADAPGMEGKVLPFASLRAVLQVQVPEAVMLARDLGKPWGREEGGVFMQVAEGSGGTCASRAAAALQTWVGMVLRPWAVRIGLDEDLVDQVAEVADAQQAFVLESGTLDIAQSMESRQSFERQKHAVLQEVSRRLEGQELFGGLGRVYRIVRGRSSGNRLEFQTWPVAAKAGSLYSMVACVSLITVPYREQPVLVVEASRRRWLDEVPPASKLRRQRVLVGFLMGRSGSPIAVEFTAPLRSGEAAEPCSPEFMHQALAVRADLALPFAEMVRARGQDVFMGVPYSPQRDGRAKVGAGATTRDHLDLLDVVAERLLPIGLRPLPFRETVQTKKAPKRAEEFHKALIAEALVADFSINLGRNSLSDADLQDAARALLEGGEPPAISEQAALTARKTLELIREANRDRIVRAFVSMRPTIVLIARRESERRQMRAAVSGLFGGAVDIAERQLPRDVHGPRQDLSEAGGKATVRFAARIEAWRELAEELSLTYGGCHALVQADEWYDRRHDDEVNKLAGRQALATIGEANVQYLLPAAGGWRGLAQYLNRIQSAVYDLMFGHAALVSEVRSLLRGDFPVEASRPRAIIGISVVSQSRLRFGAQGSQICMATRIDALTGRTSARLGWFDKAMRWTPWLPFFDAMKRIANLDVAQLGPSQEVRRRSYQSFVETVIDEAVYGGDRPVVLIDANVASGLWPWLTDARIGGPLLIGPESIDKSAPWAPARLVRVRTNQAGRVLERKSASYERLEMRGGCLVTDGVETRYCPTVTAKTIEVSANASGARSYWVTSGYLETWPRGLSVFRELDFFMPVDKVKGLSVPSGIPTKGLLTRGSIDLSAEPYRVPNGMDVTVATPGSDDDPDRIAHLVASLRYGYGHSRLPTTLPAPLFFEAKARDYMARFDIAAMDEDGGADGDGATLDVAVGTEDLEGGEPNEPGDDLLVDTDGGPGGAGGVPIIQPVAELASAPPVTAPTLTGRWSGLLGRSLAVSLVGSTSLSGQRDAWPLLPVHPQPTAPFGLPLILSSNEQAAPKMTVDPLPANKSEPRWISANRDKLLPVPEFITRDWLATRISLKGNARLVREIHNWRQEIRDMTGFFWPTKRPEGADAAAEVFLAGLGHANFLRVLSRVAIRCVDEKKRDGFDLLGPFQHEVDWARWEKTDKAVRPRPPQRRRTVNEMIAVLMEHGWREQSMALVYFFALGGFPFELCSGIAKAHGFRELDAFLAAFIRLEDDFDWERDVRRADSPAKPPLPRDDEEPEVSPPGPPSAPERDHTASAATLSPSEVVLESDEEGNPEPGDEIVAETDPAASTPIADEDPVIAHDLPSAPLTAPDVVAIGTEAAPEECALDVAAAAWRQAFDRIGALVSAARTGEPEPGMVDSILAVLLKARTAAEVWEAARPRLADAVPLLRRAKELLEALSTLKRAPDTTGIIDRVEVPFLVLPDMAEEARALVDEGGRSVDVAATDQNRAVALWDEGGLDKLDEIQAVNRSAEESMRVAVERISAAVALLAAGRQRDRATSDVVRHGESSPAPRDHHEILACRTDAAVVPVPATVAAEQMPVEQADAPAGAASSAVDPDGSVNSVDEDEPGADAEYEMAETVEDGADEPPLELPPAAAPSAAPDPLIGEIADKLEAFVEKQDFGLAYHLLRAARRVFADASFRFSGAELRLAAMSGRISHSAMQGSNLLERVVGEAVESVLQSGERGDVADARRIIVGSACAELAMFHSTLPGVIGIEAIGEVTPELSEAFHDLRKAVVEGSTLTFITPALLRTVGQEAEDDRYQEDCRKAVLESIDVFSKLKFSWVPANKIRGNLCLKSGVVGTLKDNLLQGDGVAVSAARAFSLEYRDRSAIMALVDKVDRGVVKFRGLDGAARERMLSAFEGLAALCAEFVEASDAAPSARNSSHNKSVRRISQAVSAGIDRASRGLSSYGAGAPRLSASAVQFALGSLQRLKDVVEGRMAPVGINDHLLAVHGPLLWLPGLHYGASWLPSPYRPEEFVASLLEVSVHRHGSGAAPTDEDYRAAVRARMEEGSFIAARMLIQARGFYGIDEKTSDAMATLLDGDIQSSQSALKDSIDETRGLVDKVQRMGGLVRADQANATLDRLDRIKPESLPSDVSVDTRTEEEEPEQIMDFCSARDVVADVRDRIKGLLDPPRAALLRRLDALADRARPGDIDRVRGIISDHDDLITAGEYIRFMEEGGTLPETTFTNRRFHEFFPQVPDALGKLGRQALDSVQAALEAGSDLDVLPFSRVPEDRRAQALEILGVWRDLRRRVMNGVAASAIHPMLDAFLTMARLTPEMLNPVAALKNLPPKTYASEFRLNLAGDKDSLLLPDFGSLTRFHYRICVTPQMPTDSELGLLCQDPGTYGVIVIVMSAVDTRRRERLAVTCMKANLRVLVIDEAILLHALTEPEFRPLTMFECAQPFSFAAPYRDYGNAAVPPEMFFGRETEIRKITERMGSCVVYGGRRLGKTALLRHVKELHDDPERSGSTAVGYSNIRDMGAMPSRVWEYASRDLPTIFQASVKTPGDFTARVRAWLDGDPRRRVLLLLDEADGFIAGDAKQQFPEFGRLQDLMDGTSRRFKVVLAGLHNVTRIVRTENSPLKQIASDPQRIGPLMDAELPDAERLVARPLSAMGFEFQNRSDIWRILSHCNYYPVLVQTFCAGLLEALGTARKTRAVWEITGKQVREAIDDEAIRKEIGQKFDYTIREIDQRYELIACVVAEQALLDNSSGRVDEGMSTVDVLDAVCGWWPQAFDHAHRLETVKDLLDEMVGLGVLRQTSSGSWALRSHAILRLLGDEGHVTTRLLSFVEMPPPRAFDPRSMRRGLTLPSGYKEAADYPCPLTVGQEHDLFAGDARITAVFGNALSDVAYVAEALRTADPVAADGTRMTVRARTFSSMADMMEAVREAGKSASPTVIVVDQRSQWDSSWVEAALRQRHVREGSVRLALVGNHAHALQWVLDPRVAKLPSGVRVMPLQTWAEACVEHELGRDNLPPERFAVDLRRVTGGFNKAMASIVAGFTGNPDRFGTRIKSAENRIAKERKLLADLGLVPPVAGVFRRIAEWADESGRIGIEEVRDGSAEALLQAGLTAEQAIEYGIAMGILEAQALSPGDPAEARCFVMTPLLRVALAQAHPVGAD